MQKIKLIPISIVIAGLIIAGAIIISIGNTNIAKEIVATKQAAQVLPDSYEETFNISGTSHIRGDFSAPITLVEFSDFECPFCVRHLPTLNKILSDYPNQVRLVYKHFPLGFHPNSQKAAEASECADEQGKFWEYHDKLFENQPAGYSLDKFKQWAKDLGLNSGKFNDCLDSGKFAQKVQADFQEGSEKGVNGTPATFVNGQLISGALPYESFKQVIDSILKK
ncbi:MAG: DsbA family protein [bacterium]|nr:DsbA family protein [bacterium]